MLNCNSLIVRKETSMKKVLSLLIGLCISSCAFAENLLEVYEQAKSNNPELYSASAQKDKAHAAVAGSRAALLPQLGLTGSYGITHGERANNSSKSKSGQIALGLTQTLFDFGTWKALNISQKQAALQDISYYDQEQQLILNTATAYFNVLNSTGSLHYLQTQKKAFARQLEQTKQKYRVGLVAITDVQNIKTNYDQTIAQLVTAHNQLNNNIENLRQITGRFYANLSQIDNNSFNTAHPQHINQLLQQAESTNFSLLIAKLGQEIARDQIRLSQSGHLPRLTVSASAGLSRNKYYGSQIPELISNNNDKIMGENNVALNLDLPIFSSGAIHSKVQEAQYNYVDYSERLESTNRKVVNSVRSSYNDISAAISSIDAYKQAVISAQSSLEATESGYRVGTRTIVDVLSATTMLYNTKQQLANMKYSYFISILKLKYALGTLSVNDLTYLNSMLSGSTSTIIDIDK